MSTYLILPGYHHLSINTFPFYGIHYDLDVLRRSAIMVFAFSACLLAGYSVPAATSRRQASKSQRRSTSNTYRLAGNTPLAITFSGLSVVSALLYVASVGPARAFARRGVEALTDAGTDSPLLPFLGAAVIASALYTALLLRFGVNRRFAWVLLAINFPPFIVVNWPPGLSRFALFGYILLFSLIFFDFRRKQARILLPAMFVFGALIAMPIVDSLTRNADRETAFSYGNVLDQYFTSGDFDGMQSVNNASLFGRERGYQYGRQLISAALFFIPRSIWTGKARPTGTITAEAAGFKFTNISQPLPSEIYVDFGLPGVIVGGFLIGLGLARLDRWIDRRWEETPAARLMAGIVVSYSIILYRGTLLGVIAGPALVLLATLFLWKFGLKRATPARSQTAAFAPYRVSA
jgi:hypothetical protein